MKTRTDIINLLFKKYGFENYLEIGVQYPANNFNKINAKFKESIDPYPRGECTYIMTSDDFFKNCVVEKKFDIIFIDALHTREQTYRDAHNSIKILNEGGFIVMHDCNPINEYDTRPYEDFLKTFGIWNGTVFRAFLQLKYELRDWCCFVVDEDYGCGILTKRNLFESKRHNNNMGDVSWDEFNNNRIDLLDLVSYDFYEKIISNDNKR